MQRQFTHDEERPDFAFCTAEHYMWQTYTLLAHKKGIHCMYMWRCRSTMQRGTFLCTFGVAPSARRCAEQRGRDECGCRTELAALQQAPQERLLRSIGFGEAAGK